MSDWKRRVLMYTKFHSLESDPNRGRRGQINLRIAFGIFVLILIAKPLTVAAADIQTSLAATPAFSWLSASVIALLIVATIVAAAVGVE